jgi:hypothetical protein
VDHPEPLHPVNVEAVADIAETTGIDLFCRLLAFGLRSRAADSKETASDD